MSSLVTLTLGLSEKWIAELIAHPLHDLEIVGSNLGTAVFGLIDKKFNSNICSNSNSSQLDRERLWRGLGLRCSDGVYLY